MSKQKYKRPPVEKQPAAAPSTTDVLEPVAQEPVAHEPMAHEPVTLEPMVLETMALEPLAPESTEAEPVSAEPAAAEVVPAEPTETAAEEVLESPTSVQAESVEAPSPDQPAADSPSADSLAMVMESAETVPMAARVENDLMPEEAPSAAAEVVSAPEADPASSTVESPANDCTPPAEPEGETLPDHPQPYERTEDTAQDDQPAPAEDTPPVSASPEQVLPEQVLPDPASPAPLTTAEAQVGPAEDVHVEDARGEDAGGEDARGEAAPAAPAAGKPAVVASSFSDKTFSALSWLGPLGALLFLLAQTLPGMDLRALWLPFETVQPALLDSLRQGADPLLLTLNGAPYPDLPPLWFWFLTGLDMVWKLTPLPHSMPLLLLGGSVCAAFLLLFFTWALARMCGSGAREAFAACAVLLSTFSLSGLAHTATPDLLFAACVTASCLCLYAGWMRTSAPLTLLVGFLLAGVSVLIKSPAGLLLPLGASLLFLFWRGTFRRAGAADGAFAFAVLLAALGGWLAWLGLTYGRAPLEALLGFHLPQWSLAFWTDPQRWLCDGIALVVLTLPWPLLVLFLPWERLYRLPVLLWRTRHENPGTGFVWCALIVALVLTSLNWPGSGSMLVVAAPFFAILAGRAILRLSPARSKGFFGLVGVTLFVVAIVLGVGSLLPYAADWLPKDLLVVPDRYFTITALPGMAFVAGAALLFSFILLKFTDKTFPGGGLLVLLLFVTVAMQPVGLLTLPHLAPLKAVTAPAGTPAAAETSAPVEAPAVAPVAPTETPAPVAPSEVKPAS